MTYLFLGTVSRIGEITLNDFGQSVELDQATAMEAIRGKCALLPLADSEFTPEELKQYNTVGSHRDAPPEFLAKVRQAHIKVHEIREQLTKGN